MPTRMTPWARSMLNDVRRAAVEDVSEKNPVGAFDPSLMRKIGSSPFDWVKIELMRATEMPNPSSSLWQLLHVRPLAPRFRKKGFVVAFVLTDPVSEK